MRTGKDCSLQVEGYRELNTFHLPDPICRAHTRVVVVAVNDQPHRGGK